MKNTYTSEQKQTIIARYISSGEIYSQISADTGLPNIKNTIML